MVQVVDDEFAVAELLSDLLTDEGYHVVTAAGGKEGLARLRAAKPDLVLLDFMMPSLNGAEVLKTMAGDPTTRDIPVVMMSAISAPTLAEQCNGYAAFLRKPFKMSAVVETVARLIGGVRSSN